MTDARERRRQRAQETKQSFDAKDFLKKFRVPIVIVLLAGGGIAIAANVDPAEAECPGHWHPVLEVYVEDQKLQFTHPRFQDQQNPDAPGFHIHDASGVLHFHPAAPRCIPLEDAMAHLAMEKTSDAFVVGPEYGDALAGQHPISGDKQLRIYVNEWGSQEWKARSASYLGDQPGNGDRILIVYGNQTEDQIAAMQQNVVQIPDNYTPQEADATAANQTKFVRIMMIIIFSLLAIMMWYYFAKKTW